MKKIAFILFAITLGPFLFAQDDTVYKQVELPAGYSSQLNMVYVKVGDWEGRLDLYRASSGKRQPLLINIHGGGWNKGVKESQTGFNTFFKEGFAVANVEYRLSQQATAPAAVEDVRCALLYLLQNAKALNLDPGKFVVMGSSAGAHLALMAGMLGNDHRFDARCAGVSEVKVAAIIDKYGITDVWDWAYGPNKTSKSATQWLGQFAKDKEFAASVSPVSYVSPKMPPVLVVHGDADPTVPYQQSVAFYQKVEAAGVTSQFISVPGGLHGKFDKEKNSEINRAIIGLLKKVGVL